VSPSRRPELYQWKQQLAKRFPNLSPAFIGLLALWSLGMLLSRRCGLVCVTTHLVPLLGQSFHTVRQRLREFYQEAPAKAGAKRGIKRRDFQVTDCFAPLLAWILSFWSQRRLALALDVTNLGERLHILCISVLFGGIGLPVAWKILPGNQKESWHPHWCDLLERLHRAVGADWEVVVLSDRGLESARLFAAIVGLHWHPLMRAKGYGKFRPEGWVHWYAMQQLVPRVGNRFAGSGQAYKTGPLRCTLLALWEEGHEEPWLLLTDLPPQAAHPCWYAWRAWIEQGFKVLKSAGWQEQQTRMTKPERLERLWLALAVTTLWLVAVGAEVERRAEIETIGTLPQGDERALPGEPKRPRKQRLFQQGCAVILAALVRNDPLPEGRLYDSPWPEPWRDLPNQTEDEFLCGKTYS
jgi:hypothetical protein